MYKYLAPHSNATSSVSPISSPSPSLSPPSGPRSNNWKTLLTVQHLIIHITSSISYFKVKITSKNYTVKRIFLKHQSTWFTNLYPAIVFSPSTEKSESSQKDIGVWHEANGFYGMSWVTPPTSMTCQQPHLLRNCQPECSYFLKNFMNLLYIHMHLNNAICPFFYMNGSDLMYNTTKTSNNLKCTHSRSGWPWWSHLWCKL